MTEEEGKRLVKDHIKERRHGYGWWIFSLRPIKVEFTKIRELRYGETLSPREELSFPHFVMTERGLDFGDLFYAWEEMYGTAIKTETIYGAGESSADMEHLIFCLKNGDVKEYMLGDTAYLKGLLGHYIELYKQASQKSY